MSEATRIADGEPVVAVESPKAKRSSRKAPAKRKVAKKAAPRAKKAR